LVEQPVVKTKDSAATAEAVAKPVLEIRIMGDTPFLCGPCSFFY
jgi:hypothetical protein